MSQQRDLESEPMAREEAGALEDAWTDDNEKTALADDSEKGADSCDSGGRLSPESRISVGSSSSSDLAAIDNKAHALPSGRDVEAYVAAQRQQQLDRAASGQAEHDPLLEHDNSRDVLALKPRPRAWWFARLSGWGGTMRFVATYMALPFVTGVMAGMGEIFANELMFRWGWRGARPIMVAGRGGRVFPVSDELAHPAPTHGHHKD
ncbi:hypothetical protein LPJ61_000547 [Coemansia biformis]|uniref:Uncharacterized protein n=1 Tax=Coemansia biformis TaxID=1286918 RepID=A0A9W7YIF6_9FUNG|nr:hypothetical protein LPJ61_000547 [Coemansia biformis]